MSQTIDNLSRMIKDKIEKYEEAVSLAMNRGDLTEVERLINGFDSFMEEDFSQFEDMTDININDFCQGVLAV